MLLIVLASCIFDPADVLLVSLAIGAALGALGTPSPSRSRPGLRRIFRDLPDAEVRCRDVRVGALVTGVLFEAGKYGIGFSLGKSNPGGAFGLAGSLALVLTQVWPPSGSAASGRKRERYT